MRLKKISPNKADLPEEDQIFDHFKIDLAELRPEVREKAIELIGQMIDKGVPKNQAVSEGIQEAETWFLESQG